MSDGSGSSKIIRSIVLIVAISALGTGAASVLYVLREEPPRRDVGNSARLVEIMVVQPEDVVEHFVGYGTAQPIRRAALAAEVAATVVERVNDLRAGGTVVAAQPLIRFDDRQYRHALQRAEALAASQQAALDEVAAEAENLQRLIRTAQQELRVAQSEKARVTSLFERQLAAKKEYDFANLASQQAQRLLQEYEGQAARIGPRQARIAASKQAYEADAALAGLNIQRCEIQAPFSGRVESLHVEVGDHVAPGSVVLTLVDATRIEIPLQLPAAVYPRVHVGGACRIECENAAGASWHGSVARIGPTVDEQTRTFMAYVEVDNTAQPQPLIPGMFAKAGIEGPLHRARLLVPRGACREGQVLVVEDGIARARAVVTERIIEDRAMVSGSLRAGDQVILSHFGQLTHGSAVRVRPPVSTASRSGLPSRAPGSEASP